ncbi:MAG TPA: ABC transporter ATP-binding protein [bacterium]|nr:ABC transporter ATP-binding protein [bacterium]
MRPKVEAIDVTVRYENPRTGVTTLALDGFSVDVQPGEFLCLVGPSGCGKTTFLHCLDGLLPLTGGRILLDGRPIVRPGRDRAMVFQSPCLLPWRTVLRNVTYGLELQGIPRREAVPRALEMISLVGLAGFERYHPAELSGGMLQRVNLARALVMDAEVILLDEPFAALDAQTREFMQAELMRIWQETRRTAVFITHQINEAIYLADRVVVLSARPGRVKSVLTVQFPRPRDLRVKRTGPFLELEDRIWALIEEEARLTSRSTPHV